jgi:hypothetical protein
LDEVLRRVGEEVEGKPAELGLEIGLCVAAGFLLVAYLASGKLTL